MNDFKVIALSILLSFGAILVWLFGIIPMKLSVMFFLIISIILLSYIFFLHKKETIENLILAFSISLLFIACADIALRLTISDRIFYRPHDKFIQKFSQQKKLSRYKPNQYFEGNVFGDLAAMTGDKSLCQNREVVFKTDSRGFRNDQAIEHDSIDIILLGDSFGMGSGTNQNETWASILTNKYKLLTYSLSIPGSPWHELMNLKIESPTLKLKPNTIVLWALFSGNDLDEEYSDNLDPDIHTGIFYTNWIKLNTFRNRSPIRLIIRGLLVSNDDKVIRRKISDQTMLFYAPYEANSTISPEEVKKHRNFPHLESVMKEMKRFTTEKGLTLIILTIPQKSDVYPKALIPDSVYQQNGFSVTIQQCCQANDIQFHDLGAKLFHTAKNQYKQNGQFVWWLDDTHWNSIGHNVAAESVFHEILRNSL